MKVPRFDIFSGTDNNAQWIEVVEGFESASRRMELYAAKCPGKYFVFDCSEHRIADSIDTSAPASATIEGVKDGRNTRCCMVAEPLNLRPGVSGSEDAG